MKVIITGGTGLIGKALAETLSGQGDQVWVLSRSPKSEVEDERVRQVGWDGKTSTGWQDLVEQADAIVNLAGENIGSSPWSPERKERILNSRLNAGMALDEAIRMASHRPQVLIQSSAVGIYGPRQDEVVTEGTALGDDYLAGVARRWEDATRSVEDLGVRRVIIRSGVVLSRKGGILSNFELPVRLGVAGPLGSGKQWLPWIHVQDEIGAICLLMAAENARGAFNLCAPDVVRQAEFSRRLAKILHRPYGMPAPAFILRLVLGQMSTLVLDGQRQVPKRLLELGYTFRFPTLTAALQDLYPGK